MTETIFIHHMVSHIFSETDFLANHTATQRNTSCRSFAGNQVGIQYICNRSLPRAIYKKEICAASRVCLNKEVATLLFPVFESVRPIGPSWTTQ